MDFNNWIKSSHWPCTLWTPRPGLEDDRHSKQCLAESRDFHADSWQIPLLWQQALVNGMNKTTSKPRLRSFDLKPSATCSTSMSVNDFDGLYFARPPRPRSRTCGLASPVRFGVGASVAWRRKDLGWFPDLLPGILQTLWKEPGCRLELEQRWSPLSNFVLQLALRVGSPTLRTSKLSRMPRSRSPTICSKMVNLKMTSAQNLKKKMNFNSLTILRHHQWVWLCQQHQPATYFHQHHLHQHCQHQQYSIMFNNKPSNTYNNNPHNLTSMWTVRHIEPLPDNWPWTCLKNDVHGLHHVHRGQDHRHQRSHQVWLHCSNLLECHRFSCHPNVQMNNFILLTKVKYKKQRQRQQLCSISNNLLTSSRQLSNSSSPTQAHNTQSNMTVRISNLLTNKHQQKHNLRQAQALMNNIRQQCKTN